MWCGKGCLDTCCTDVMRDGRHCRLRPNSRSEILWESPKRSWTSEQFIISKVILTAAGRYKYLFVDLSCKPLIRSFQKEKLQKVTEQRRQIQRVVKRTPRGVYVRWRGHPKSLMTLIQSEAWNSGNVSGPPIPKNEIFFLPHHSTVRGGGSSHCKPLLFTAGTVDFSPLLQHWVHLASSHGQDA